ncbi:MAG TPA: SRPBCC family protein [Burkholderiales bacterium]|nr:SRPBCC family protein [Burkholderiales bacterium]
MADYNFVTVWHIEAPIQEVCAAIQHVVRWPQWWQGVERIEALQTGDHSGVGSVLRCTWKSRMAYRLTFDVRITRVEPLLLVEGVASGELEGVGCWRFSRHGPVTVVRYDWRVRTTRRWMNLLAPVARTLFRWNHDALMRAGAHGLARVLGARLLGITQR